MWKERTNRKKGTKGGGMKEEDGNSSVEEEGNKGRIYTGRRERRDNREVKGMQYTGSGRQ